MQQGDRSKELLQVEVKRLVDCGSACLAADTKCNIFYFHPASRTCSYGWV